MPDHARGAATFPALRTQPATMLRGTLARRHSTVPRNPARAARPHLVFERLPSSTREWFRRDRFATSADALTTLWLRQTRRSGRRRRALRPHCAIQGRLAAWRPLRGILRIASGDTMSSTWASLSGAGWKLVTALGLGAGVALGACRSIGPNSVMRDRDRDRDALDVVAAHRPHFVHRCSGRRRDGGSRVLTAAHVRVRAGSDVPRWLAAGG